MKYVLLICDGMADDTIEELGGLTPFDAANTPVMDSIMKKGKTGLVCNCPEGTIPGSDVAILTIFGYDPAKVLTGRMALEAADMNICIKEGETALRGNILGVSDHADIMKREILSIDGTNGRDAREFAEKLLNDEEFSKLLLDNHISFYENESFRQAITIGFEPGKTYEPHSHIGYAAREILPENEILRKLTIRSLEVLKDDKLCIWFWGPGKAMSLEPFPMKGLLISATPTARGIGKLAGLDVPSIPGLSGDINTNYELKAEKALEALHSYDFVAVHVEAPDDSSHKLNPKEKVEAIERIDGRLLKKLLKGLEESESDYRILILSDHETSSLTGKHGGRPVPYMVYDSRNIYADEERAIDILLK